MADRGPAEYERRDLRVAEGAPVREDDRDARRVVEAGAGPPLPLRPLPEPPPVLGLRGRLALWRRSSRS